MSGSGPILMVPGQPITSESGFLRGHGTYFSENASNGENVLTSCVAGEVERVNRLITVKPVRSRYIGEVGDLVVGRVTSVDSKRWKVDVGAQREAVLQLSSVTLPGGEQRLRTYEDQLQMRSLFQEGDLVCAEVQMVSADGLLHLHTRSLKYGLLENGQLVTVPANLMKRLPQHHVSLPCGMDVILGRNGGVWISRTVPEDWRREIGGDSQTGLAPLAETLQFLRNRHRDTPLSKEQLLVAARVQNAVRCLSRRGCVVTPEALLCVFSRSVELALQPKDMLLEAALDDLVAGL
eukprot:gene12498-8934_t